jgi:hypothetical protein
MNMINATNEQLELGLADVKISVATPQGRIARANWWFSQMRDVVGRAMDWSTPAEARPEQIWIPGVTREVKV